MGMDIIFTAQMQKGEPMSDLISRQEVKEILRTEWDKMFPVELDPYLLYLFHAMEKIENIPSAEPGRKEGCWMTEVYEYGDGEEVADRWVEREAQRGDAAYCSVCNGVAGLDGSEEYSLTQFCPHCGVKMKNAEE